MDDLGHLEEGVYSFVFVNPDWRRADVLESIPLGRLCSEECILVIPVVGAAHEQATRFLTSNGFRVVDSSLTLTYPEKFVVCPQSVHTAVLSRKTTSECVWIAFRGESFVETWDRVMSKVIPLFPPIPETVVPATHLGENPTKKFFLDNVMKRGPQREGVLWEPQSHRKRLVQRLVGSRFLARPDLRALFLNVYPVEPPVHDVWAPKLPVCTVIPGKNTQVVSEIVSFVTTRHETLQEIEQFITGATKTVIGEDEIPENEETDEIHVGQFGDLGRIGEDTHEDAQVQNMFILTALTGHTREVRELHRKTKERKRQKLVDRENQVTKTRRGNFDDPQNVHISLVALLELEPGETLTRREANKMMMDYYRSHQLMNPEDKRYVMVSQDPELMRLFNPSDSELRTRMWKDSPPEDFSKVMYFKLSAALPALLTPVET